MVSMPALTGPRSPRTCQLLAAAAAVVALGGSLAAQTPRVGAYTIHHDDEKPIDPSPGYASAREAVRTWNAGNSGVFSDPSNWSGGVPIQNDDLFFGGSGTQAYVAANDLPTLFGGVLGNSTSSGLVTWMGGLNGLRLRLDTGRYAIAGGTWNLSDPTSVTAGSATTNTLMSLTVANTAAQSASLAVSNAAILNLRNGFVGNGGAGTLTVEGGSVVNAPTTTTPGTGGRFGINNSSGAIAFSGGSTLNAWLLEIGRNAGGSGSVSFAGANTNANVNQVAMARDGAGGTHLTVADAATLNVAFRLSPGTNTIDTGGNLFARYGDGSGAAAISVSGGGRILQRGNAYLAAAVAANGQPVGSVASLSISGADSLYDVQTTPGPFVIQGVTLQRYGGQFILAAGAPGDPATATLSVSDGGTLRAQEFFAAGAVDDVATITVGGAGARLEVRELLAAGGGANQPGGTANLTVNAGGTLAVGDLNLGQDGLDAAGGRATLLVSGADARLVASDDDGDLSNGVVSVGVESGTAGTLRLRAGGNASVAGATFLGVLAGAAGTFDVADPGSLYAGRSLVVGGGIGLTGGSGTISLSSGGEARFNLVVLGAAEQSSATASIVGGTLRSISGPGGSGDLLIADAVESSATLEIAAGGLVSVAGNAFVAAAAASDADVLVDTGGTFRVGRNLQVGSGAGRVAVASGGSLEVADALRVTAGGTLAVAGVTTADTLVVHGSASTSGTGFVRVGESPASTPGIHVATTLSGGGTLSLAAGHVVHVRRGGAIAPDGELTVVGDVVFASTLANEPAATLRIDLESAGTFDTLTLAGGGVATLAGRLVPNLVDDFFPAPGDSFAVLSAASLVGTFDNAGGASGFTRTDDGRAGFRIRYTLTQVLLDAFTLVGDVNLDGVVNNQDISPFVATLTNPVPPTGAVAFAADVDGNGVVNNQDISPFVALLTGGRGMAELSGDPDFAPLAAAVPEPAGLAVLATLGVLLARRRRT
jgi:hypothetical protein